MLRSSVTYFSPTSHSVTELPSDSQAPSHQELKSPTSPFLFFPFPAIYSQSLFKAVHQSSPHFNHKITFSKLRPKRSLLCSRTYHTSSTVHNFCRRITVRFCRSTDLPTTTFPSKSRIYRRAKILKIFHYDQRNIRFSRSKSTDERSGGDTFSSQRRG